MEAVVETIIADDNYKRMKPQEKEWNSESGSKSNEGGYPGPHLAIS